MISLYSEKLKNILLNLKKIMYHLYETAEVIRFVIMDAIRSLERKEI